MVKLKVLVSCYCVDHNLSSGQTSMAEHIRVAGTHVFTVCECCIHTSVPRDYETGSYDFHVQQVVTPTRDS